jgi:hypothetical protein
MSYRSIASLILCSIAGVLESSEQRMLRHKSAQNLYDEGVRTEQGRLDFPHMQVTTVEDLRFVRYQLQCDALTEINAQRNHLLLRDLIVVLKQAPNLEKVDFSHNEVGAICDIPIHEHLDTIVLNDNHIQRFDFKNFFTNLRRLDTCLLHNNPLHAAGVTNVKGGPHQISTAWFDERALTPRTIAFCTRAFPNLECELIPGSRVVQKKYTRYEAWYADHWDSDDFFKCALIGSACGAIIGCSYGLFAAHKYYWRPDHMQIIGVIFLYGIAVGILGALVVPLGAKAWSHLHGYYTTHPDGRYLPIETRKIRPYPYLLGHRTYNEQQRNLVQDLVQGQEVNAIIAQEE